MRPSYLRPPQVAEALSISLDTVHRRIAAGELPALWLGPRLVRIPARALEPTAPPVVPWGAPAVGVGQLADAWQINPRTLHRLAAAGVLPGKLIGGRWSFSRARLRHAVERLTIGVEQAA